MREIKFRAWNKETREMKRVDEIGLSEGWIEVQGGLQPYGFDSYQLMQYTGLKDKNGVEIYEGDIVLQRAEWNETAYREGGYESSESCETETLGVVSITASKGVVINKCKVRDVIACDSEWVKAFSVNVRGYRAQVIGDIHQNPELIKGE